jgi:hypothetical protein
VLCTGGIEVAANSSRHRFFRTTSLWNKSQAHLAAPLAGRVRQMARGNHGGQASRLNDVDEAVATINPRTIQV